MTETAIAVSIIRILFVCIIIIAAYIISTRNLLTVVSVYSLQSLTLVGIALALWSLEGSIVLLEIAVVTLISKVIIIPYFIATIQEKIRIKRDIEFHFLSPTTSLILSMALMLVIYMALGRIIPGRDNLFFFGAVLGISLMLMGMMVTFSRKRTITKVLGFLSMENGVLLFGMFVTELPFIIEFLIIIDLIILVILTTILSVGIDSTLEDYHKRLHRFHLLDESEEVP
ncbi:MAG: hydrogenase subunit [Methanoregula sp.]|jgi:hydrogenase-4 component E